MPASLDDDTRGIILKVTSITVSTLTCASFYAYRVMQQEKKNENEKQKKNHQKARRNNQNGKKQTSSTSTSTSSSSRSSSRTGGQHLTRLVVQCLASLGLMLVMTTVLTFAILLAGKQQQLLEQQSEEEDNSITTSSSINFCEWDFQDHPSVAEPANTASSIASYVPLALIGLFGKPSNVWKKQQRKQNQNQNQNDGGGDGIIIIVCRRFAVAYTTLLGIGIGSTLLHAMLTATTQGGDELPMLWFTASTGYIVADILLVAKQQQKQKQQPILENPPTKSSSSRKKTTVVTLLRRFMPWLFFVSAVVATSVYVLARDNFLPFYIMFTLYCWITLIGLLCVCFGIDVLNWDDINISYQKQEEEDHQDQDNAGQDQNTTNGSNEKEKDDDADVDDDDDDDICFKADVLLPIAICTAISAMVGISVWTSEMVYCADAQSHSLPIPGHLGAWFYNRVAHVIWHCSTGLLAWLLIQFLVAAKGIQDGWGSTNARVKWWLVPYVSFDDDEIQEKHQQQQHITQS